MNGDQSTVAIYWDFENIHASLLDQAKGSGTYKQSRFSAQEKVVDVEALMEFAASLGSVAINRAYGNWQWFAKYREVLLHNAVELIQLFPSWFLREEWGRHQTLPGCDRGHHQVPSHHDHCHRRW